MSKFIIGDKVKVVNSYNQSMIGVAGVVTDIVRKSFAVLGTPSAIFKTVFWNCANKLSH